MAEITVRGFSTKGEQRESSKGLYSRFSLSEGQKQQDGTYKKVWYNVTNFKSKDFPADGSKVEVKGILKMKVVQDGAKTYYDILAAENGISVLEPPKEFVQKEPGVDGAPKDKDPWE